METIDFEKLIPKFDAILARGLCRGVGDREGQMSIEAAICAALDLPHGDEPEYVASAVRSFKITLNDSNWSSPEARASAAIIAVMTAVFGFAQWTGISRCQGLLLDIVICLAALVLKP